MIQMPRTVLHPRTRDFMRYPVYVADGANRIEITSTPGTAIVTIPPGWYYQHGEDNASYPGLWRAIIDGYAPQLDIRPCTPTDSIGLPGCGIAFRHIDKVTDVTVSLDISDALPPETIGWAGVGPKTGPWVTSEMGARGVWRSNNKLDGEGQKIAHLESVVYMSHPGPTARFQRWRTTPVVDFEYREVPAIWVRRSAAWEEDHAAWGKVRFGNESAAFDNVWESMGRGQKMILHPDCEEPPFGLAFGNVFKLRDERSAQEFRSVATPVSVDAEERYNINLPTYFVERL